MTILQLTVKHHCDRSKPNPERLLREAFVTENETKNQLNLTFLEM